MKREKRKVLLLAPMASVHEQFNNACVDALLSLNSEIHLAANFGMDDCAIRYADFASSKGLILHDFHFVRRSLRYNLQCLQPLKNLLKEEQFDLVHAHTETGGILTMLTKSTNSNTKYIYTPHGMSFWQGSSLFSQIVYRPIEWWICKAMDINIAVNLEEYDLLKMWDSLKARYIPGIGLNIAAIRAVNSDINEKKRELGLPLDARVLLSVGELNSNKNHITIVKALSKLDLPDNLYYLICGRGPHEKKIRALANAIGLGSKVILVGYRQDIYEIMQMADYFVFPSYHEGLPVSVMEAMAFGLPIVGSQIRGVTDLIKNNEGGYLYAPSDLSGFAQGLSNLFADVDRCTKMGSINQNNIKSYDIHKVKDIMSEVYSRLLV